MNPFDILRSEQENYPTMCSEGTRIVHGLMGLQTEVGELTDIFKRSWFYKENKNIAKEVIEELGDILWYFILILDVINKENATNYTLDDIIKINYNKLKTRYPDKFDSDKAINRNICNEQNAIDNTINNTRIKTEKCMKMFDKIVDIVKQLKEFK